MAFIGSILALPFPIAGIHKFYLGQPLWGIIYLLLWQTPIPRVACAIDAVWYLIQDNQFLANYFPTATAAATVPSLEPKQVEAIGAALRELERLRQEGLISEYEFEEKRRQLLQ
jgi:TM2 domain-containing membrane protein YozV